MPDRENQRMKCFSQVPESQRSNLAVVLARVLIEDRGAEVELEGLIETDPAQADVTFALLRVERDLHMDDCSAKLES